MTNRHYLNLKFTQYSNFKTTKEKNFLENLDMDRKIWFNYMSFMFTLLYTRRMALRYKKIRHCLGSGVVRRSLKLLKNCLLSFQTRTKFIFLPDPSLDCIPTELSRLQVTCNFKTGSCAHSTHSCDCMRGHRFASGDSGSVTCLTEAGGVIWLWQSTQLIWRPRLIMLLRPLNPLLASLVDLAECYTKKPHWNCALFSIGGSGVAACAFGPQQRAPSVIFLPSDSILSCTFFCVKQWIM
jgi:hypothetical protein